MTTAQQSRFRRAVVLAVAAVLASGTLLAAQDDAGGVRFASCLRGTCFDPCADDACGGDDDEAKCCYGPPRCQPRMTLLQWSYGTSFSGGPDLDEPLVTDRPDFTEASTTVGLGVAQLELGWTYTYDNDGAANTKSHSYPETLLRYGMLAEWFELRLAWNYADEQAAGIHSRGSEHLYLGAKLGLTPQEGILPEMAIIPQMFVPIGSRALTADETLAGVNWLYGWDVTESISTAGSTQFNRAVDDITSNGYTEWAQSWTIGYSLTDRLGAYTEWYAFFPHGADTARPEHYFNGGFSFLISNDVSWDVRAGVGLNDAADDYFVGTGMAVRFK
jgi:hypothetical protein